MAVGVNLKCPAQIPVLTWNKLHPAFGNWHFNLLIMEAQITHPPPYGFFEGFQGFRNGILPAEM
jgi:hypothetical protein